MNLLQEIASGLSGIEQLRKMMQTERRAPMAETLDIRLVEVDEGRVVFEATPEVRFYNPIGTVQGGFAATVLDFACGYAVLSMLRADQGFSTLELKTAYHRAIKAETGPLTCEGKVVSIGRRAAFTEAHLKGLDGTLYASGTSSLVVLS